MTSYTGGCPCGAVRYEADGDPIYAGHCYCADCRKMSGSGFIPFLGFPTDRLRITGETIQFRSLSYRGTEAVRNSCAICGGLVFGGELGKDSDHTIYAGSLDDPALFEPQVAIFVRDRPHWAPAPAGITEYETMPG